MAGCSSFARISRRREVGVWSDSHWHLLGPHLSTLLQEVKHTHTHQHLLTHICMCHRLKGYVKIFKANLSHTACSMEARKLSVFKLSLFMKMWVCLCIHFPPTWATPELHYLTTSVYSSLTEAWGPQWCEQWSEVVWLWCRWQWDSQSYFISTSSGLGASTWHHQLEINHLMHTAEKATERKIKRKEN